MEELPKDIILKYNANTLEEVRRETGVDIRGLKEALDILEEWTKKQTHFNKTDFARDYLERELFLAKGSIERAKQKIDKMCTLRTLLAEFFVWKDPRKDFQDVDKIICQVHLPKLTKDNYRVHIQKLCTDDFTSSDMFQFYIKSIMLTEYMRRYDYCSGYHLIADIRDVNILNLVTKFSPIDLKNLMTILTEGYGMRTKGIHLLTSSTMVDTLVSFLKKILSPKLGSRIFVHRNLESLYQYTPKYVLPVDYGGTEKSLKELSDDWLNVIDTEEYRNYFEDMLKANTDESRRQTHKFNEEYIGTPGSFRSLTVD